MFALCFLYALDSGWDRWILSAKAHSANHLVSSRHCRHHQMLPQEVLLYALPVRLACGSDGWWVNVNWRVWGRCWHLRCQFPQRMCPKFMNYFFIHLTQRATAKIFPFPNCLKSEIYLSALLISSIPHFLCLQGKYMPWVKGQRCECLSLWGSPFPQLQSAYTGNMNTWAHLLLLASEFFTEFWSLKYGDLADIDTKRC